MNIKKILILSIFAIAIAGIIAPASAAIDSADNNKVYSVESKEKTVTNKITWNANGGKIGSKTKMTTTVKKGSKIGKLVTTPKRTNATFLGWYTKSKGGTKITKNTKITKSITVYAQWKVKKPTQKEIDEALKKKFVGKWRALTGEFYLHEWTFKSDGSYSYDQVRGGKFAPTLGVYIEAVPVGTGIYQERNGAYSFLKSGTLSCNSHEYRWNQHFFNNEPPYEDHNRVYLEFVTSEWDPWEKSNGNGYHYFQYGVTNGKEWIYDTMGTYYYRV